MTLQRRLILCSWVDVLKRSASELVPGKRSDVDVDSCSAVKV